MHFGHSSELWADFPQLVPGVLFVDGISADAPVDRRVEELCAVAASRLTSSSEGELPEIQAWRRAFSRMGLEPTRYRCAAEALLRRFRKEGLLPRIHPLVDLCNATSLAFAVPIAVFDVSEIAGFLEVRHAAGDESYLSFSGEVESLEAREVIFADAAGRAHARRWTNRQSAYSAVRETTSAALIVAEALHESAPADVEQLRAAIAGDLTAVWRATPKTALLSRSSPRFEL